MGDSVSNDLFELAPLRRGDQLGFRVTFKGDARAERVKVEWQYESAGSDHPRPEPLKDRIVRDFEPGEQLERWFTREPGDGLFYALVDDGSGPLVFNLSTDPDESGPLAYREVR